MQTRCGSCHEELTGYSAQGMVDAIRLHCREYHPTFGDNGAVFDKLTPRLYEFYMNAYEGDEP